jgi:hypothetical protein
VVWCGVVWCGVVRQRGSRTTQPSTQRSGEGMPTREYLQSAREVGDRIGLLLDLDQGSMTVCKNDERLGVMVRSGLSGEYCWAVSVGFQGGSVRIEHAVAPAP